MYIMNKKLTVLLALGCQLSAFGAPLDDLNNEALTDTSKVVDLDEVVVVAQPKEPVRLRLQPVSSNVFGSQQLQQLNVRDLSQLSQYVPAFTPSTGLPFTLMTVFALHAGIRSFTVNGICFTVWLTMRTFPSAG